MCMYPSVYGIFVDVNSEPEEGVKCPGAVIRIVVTAQIRY